MKKITFSLLALLTLCSLVASAQDPAVAALKAEHIKVVLVKEIENITDSTKHHTHHEPHRSNHKIIHVTLDISKNPEYTGVVKGKKSVIMLLTDSHGLVISEAEAGGGIYMLDGKETHFTLRHMIEFDGSTYKLDFLYKNPHRFHKGTHVLSFYSDGIKIGEEHF